jgi:hypothetical protein
MHPLQEAQLARERKERVWARHLELRARLKHSLDPEIRREMARLSAQCSPEERRQAYRYLQLRIGLRSEVRPKLARQLPQAHGPGRALPLS